MKRLHHLTYNICLAMYEARKLCPIWNNVNNTSNKNSKMQKATITTIEINI